MLQPKGSKFLCIILQNVNNICFLQPRFAVPEAADWPYTIMFVLMVGLIRPKDKLPKLIAMFQMFTENFI